MQALSTFEEEDEEIFGIVLLLQTLQGYVLTILEEVQYISMEGWEAFTTVRSLKI